MSTLDVVLEVLQKAKPAIAAHWADFSDLPGHTRARIKKVDQALEKYCQALSKLKQATASQDAILAAMKVLFARLDEINDEVDGLLLETDERDLLVPVITEAAVAAGLDVSTFEHGDPTLQFRNF